MAEPKFQLQIRLLDPWGRVKYVNATELEPDVCSDMERAVSDMHLAHDVGMSIGMDATVTLMRRRQFRRDLFVALARNLGMQMADFMEDKEGWHGRDRAESARDRAKDFDR